MNKQKVIAMEIEQRTLNAAHYIVENNSTIRTAAKSLGYSKTTIHTDLTKNLPLYDKNLFKQVQLVITNNKRERAMRGGMALKKKYLSLNQQK